MSSVRRRKLEVPKKTGNEVETDTDTDGVAYGASDGDASDSKPEDRPTVLLVDNKKKWKSWWVRFWTTWAMLGGFILLMWGGHFPLTAFIFFCQTAMYKEIVSLGHVHARENKLPGFRHLQWFWYGTGQLFCYSYVLTQIPWDLHLPEWKIIHTFFKDRLFVSFTFWITGVVGFVFSLKKGQYKYQFGMFSWCHLVILLVILQSSLLVVNLFNGLLWLVFPCLLIISNDMFAYFFGFFWGKTPLIKLSPKKTWEGFIGAMFATFIIAFFLSRFLAGYDNMICPKTEVSWRSPTCKRTYQFIPIQYDTPSTMLDVCRTVGLPCWETFSIMPIQFHALALAMFASIIAPFGGFFASGFKRAFKIKDFGNSIPGHGGLTDRFDCQIMMGLFVYVYYITFIKAVTSSSLVVSAFARLSTDEQLAAYSRITRILDSEGLLQG